MSPQNKLQLLQLFPKKRYEIQKNHILQGCSLPPEKLQLQGSSTVQHMELSFVHRTSAPQTGIRAECSGAVAKKRLRFPPGAPGPQRKWRTAPCGTWVALKTSLPGMESAGCTGQRGLGGGLAEVGCFGWQDPKGISFINPGGSPQISKAYPRPP